MKDLMTEINTLFDLCEQVNMSLKTVDASAQYSLMLKTKKQCEKVFVLLENAVNPMGKKDLLKEIPNREVVLKLYFIILKCLYYFSRVGIPKFGDMRCQGSTILAYKLMYELNFKNKFGQSQTWINNDSIYDNVFFNVASHLHPTNMQSLVRCLATTLMYPEVKCQKVPDYMSRFENYILYYLMQSPQEERVYLDYI